MTLREVLSDERSTPSKPLCLAQDPGRTENDISVLKRNGMSILPDPRGFLEVDDTSVVISMGPDAPVRQIVMDVARPAIMIWDRVYEDGPERGM